MSSGALATVAGLRLLQCLGTAPRNVWEHNTTSSSHLSVITFGCPTVMYHPKRTANTSITTEQRRLFHNVIDPNDLVPLAYNVARANFNHICKLFNLNDSGVLDSARSLLADGVKLALDIVGVNDGPWRLLVALLKFGTPSSAIGVHVGTIVLLMGARDFRRITQDYRGTMTALFQAGLSCDTLDSIRQPHCMESYYGKWNTFSGYTANPPAAFGPAFDLPTTIVPDVDVSSVNVRQTETGLNFTVLLDTIVAQQTFDVGRLRIGKDSAVKNCNLPLDLKFSPASKVCFQSFKPEILPALT